MQVTNASVTYDRKRQPAQYESAGASVSFQVIIGDGEDHVAVAQKLLGDAKTLVLTELGVVQPGQSASAAVIAAASTPKTTTAATDKPETAAQKKAREKKEAEGKAPSVVKAGEGGQAAGDKPNISTGEARIDPAQAALEASSDIPGEGAAATPTAANTATDLPDETPSTAPATTAPASTGVTLTHQDIHAFVANQIKDKKIDSEKVKAISATFNVTRIAELKPDQMQPYMDALKAKITELAGGKPSELDGL